MNWRQKEYIQWAYPLFVLLVFVDLLLAWRELITTGTWTLVFSSAYRLDQVMATVWLGLRTGIVVFLIIGWRPIFIMWVFALEILLGFLLACFDLSVYWRADCGCMPTSHDVYLRMGLRTLELAFVYYFRR